jgi:hypothetical protein
MRSWRNGIDPDCIAKTKAKTQTTIRQILADTLNCSFYGRVWEQLAPLVSDPVCLAAISDTNRDVAFRKNPRDFAAWLENLHANLMFNAVVAA